MGRGRRGDVRRRGGDREKNKKLGKLPEERSSAQKKGEEGESSDGMQNLVGADGFKLVGIMSVPVVNISPWACVHVSVHTRVCVRK